MAEPKATEINNERATSVTEVLIRYTTDKQEVEVELKENGRRDR